MGAMRMKQQERRFMYCSIAATLMSVAFLAGPTFAQNWVDFANETGDRLQADPSVSTSDSQEKDYIVGDLDNDGDDDLICVRKQPFTSTGRDINILFMNEGRGTGRSNRAVCSPVRCVWRSGLLDANQ